MNLLKQFLKTSATGIALAVALVPAIFSFFGRVSALFVLFGQTFSLIPGLPGNYLRTAFYYLTLRRCSLESRISFGTFFSKAASTVERGVYIGSWCNLGVCAIGERTQIADHVQILSGRRQHGRGESGRILSSDEATFSKVSIGADCWIGAGAIVMEDLGAGSTIGAGAVVTKPVPAKTTAVGNPARAIERRP